MSFESDQRVVEVQFNNKQFEADVSTTISTLDKLQNKLKFEGVSKGFDELERASRKVSFEGLMDSVGRVADRFTLKGTIIYKFFDDIANRALSLERQMERIGWSMTGLDQVSVGWDKYAQKTTAVQTIMGAVANEIEDVGDRMQYVNSQLETLNWFTDETSYNFLDMVNNIGKFTANQVPLDMAVESMQGIATWAAKSGAGVNEASRAMYNLSQAISSGALKLLDWKSIELANMGTAEFKQTAIETAEAMGKIRKVGDGLWEDIATETEISVKGFRDSLKSGWLSSEVLLSTLNKYGGFATKLNAAVKETGLLTSDFLGAIEASKNGVEDLSEFFDEDVRVSYERFLEIVSDLSQSQYDFGRSAFAAAQEAKTFEEAINSVKDAVSTGWMNTFEIIFGDYNEAKRLWTGLSNYLYDVFNSSAEYRNQMLKDWKEVGGRDDLLAGFQNLATALGGIFGSIRDAWQTVFPQATWYDLVQLTKRFRAFTESLILSDDALEGLRGTFVKIFTPLRTVATVLKTAGVIVLSFALALRDSVVRVLDFIGKSKSLGDLFSRLAKKSKLFEAALGIIYTALTVLAIGFDFVTSIFANFNAALQDSTGTSSFLSALGSIVAYIGGTFGKAILTVGEILRKCFGFMSEHVFTAQNLATAFNMIATAVRWVSEAMQAAFSWCLGLFQGFSVVEKQEEKVIENTTKTVERFSLFQKIFQDLKDGFKIVGDAISTLITSIFSKSNIHSIEDLGNAIGNFFSRLNTGKVVALGVAVAMFILLGSIDKLIKAVTGFISSMTSFGDVFKSVTGYFKALAKATKYSALLQIGAGIMEIAAALWIISKIPRDRLWDTVAVLSAIVVVSAAFAGAMTMIASSTAEMLKAAAAIATLGAGLMVFVLAFKQVQSLSNVTGSDIAYMLSLMAYFTAGIIAIGNLAPKFNVSASNMIAFAASIYIMATAFKKISDAAKDVNYTSILALIGIIASFTAAMAFMGKSNASAGAGVLMTVASMLLFVHVLKRLTGLKVNNWLSFTAGLVSMIATLGTIAVALSAMSGPILLATAGLGVAVAAMHGVWLLLDRIANWEFDINNLIHNGFAFATAAGMIMVAFAKLAQAVPIGFAIKAQMGSLVGIGVAVLAIAAGLRILSGTNWNDIGAGVTGLSLTLIAFGAATLLASRFQASSRALVAMAIDIGAIVAALTVLSLLGKDVYPAAVALGGTLVALGVAFFGAGKLAASADGKAIRAMVIDVVAVAGSIVAIMYFAKDWKTVVAAATGLGAALLALGGAMALIGQYDWKLSDLIGVVSAAGLAVAVAYALSLLANATQGVSWQQIAASAVGLGIAAALLGASIALMGQVSNSLSILAGCLAGAVLTVAIGMTLSEMAQYSEGLPQAMEAFYGAVIVLGIAVAALGALKSVSLIGAGVLDLIGLAIIEFGKGMDRFGDGVLKFATGVQQLSDGITQLGSLSSSQVTQAVKNISNFGLSMVGAIRDIYPKIESAMYDSAGYIVRGLQNGLNDNSSGVKRAAAGLFFTFQNSFEQAAQINSPSVVMWKDGQYLIYGIVNGIVENQGTLRQAAHGIWVYTHDGIEEEISQFAEDDGQLYVDGVSHKIVDSESQVESALKELALNAASNDVQNVAYAEGAKTGNAFIDGMTNMLDKGKSKISGWLGGTAVGKYYRKFTGKQATFLTKEDEQNYKGILQYGGTVEQAIKKLGYDPYDRTSVLMAKTGINDIGETIKEQAEEAASGLDIYGDAGDYAATGAGGTAAATDDISESLEELLDVFSYASDSVQYFYDKGDMLLKLYDNVTPWNNAIASTEGLVLEHYKLMNLYDEEIQAIKNFGDMNKQQAKEAKDAWVEYYGSISASISQGFGGVFTAPSFSQKSINLETTSFKTMMSNLDAQERQMTYFTNTLIKLKREGLNDVYLQSLLEAGPENLDEIVSWDQLTAEEIKKINAQYERIQNATNRLTMDYITATSERFQTLPETVEESIRAGIMNMSTYDIQNEVYNRTTGILQEVLDADGDWEQYNGTRLGELLAEGLADGIESTTDVAVEAVRKLAKEMFSKLDSEAKQAKAKQMATMASEWTSYVTARDENGQLTYKPSAQETETIRTLKNAVGYLNYRIGNNNYDPDSKGLYERWEKEGKDAASYARELGSTLDQSVIKSNLAASELAGQMYAGQINIGRIAKGMEPIYGSEVKGSRTEGYNVSITQNNYSSENLNAEKLEENLRSVAAGISK